jgi:Protein of unknown function (DUF1553)/Protein of unknown function (DUF1549)
MPVRWLVIPVVLICAVGTVRSQEVLTPERLDHWAWKKPARPPIPVLKQAEMPRSPIDAFILAKIEAAGLRPSPIAARTQLLRRVTLDLIGLPPTPEEIEAFVNDQSPNAWLHVVDRLLASPHYGERWGRHWLDLARYAESNGYELDELRPDAWRYRDYVISSLNADKAYDRFVQEQIAGDEIAPGNAEARIATGFNLLGPDMTDTADPPQRRLNTLNDMTDTVSLVFLGMTIACARCHDHKFEAIPQTDYYRLQAFFEPARFRTAPLALEDGPSAKTYLLVRGELSNRGEEVHPGFPVALGPSKAEITPAGAGSRALLATWLTRPDNPLTARVFVNRLWQHHLGRGLVVSSNDFGVRGQRPTHPALLDWLATELVANGWSTKAIHRLILTSAVYQQSTVAAAEIVRADPDNLLWTRMQRSRLDGEVIRDAMLAVAGLLDRRLAGPSVMPPAPEAAIQGSRGWKTSPDPRDQHRRSIYILARRNLRFPYLEAFDAPDSNQSCPIRVQSTTAPQALVQLNGDETMAAVRGLAKRLEDVPSPERIRQAYRLTLGRWPAPAEVEQALRFLARSPESEFYRVLFNLNEFIYRE